MRFGKMGAYRSSCWVAFAVNAACVLCVIGLQRRFEAVTAGRRSAVYFARTQISRDHTICLGGISEVTETDPANP